MTEIQTVRRAVADLRALYGQRAASAEEKYRLLAKRDAIIRRLQPRAVRMDCAEVPVGLCQAMCPEKERYWRQANGIYAYYESAAGQRDQRDRLEPLFMVKEYVRSASCQEFPLPYEIRSIGALSATMDHMLSRIVARRPDDEAGLIRWYNFFLNRTRAVRKDLIQQMAASLDAVAVLEKCARFYIYAGHRMRSVTAPGFDAKINSDNLMMCLVHIRRLYVQLRAKNVPCPNEPEFLSYSILHSLHSASIVREICRHHGRAVACDDVRLAQDLWSDFHSNNYVAFFLAVRHRASFLQACLAEPYFAALRANAVSAMVTAYGYLGRQVPVSKLVSWLGFADDHSTVRFCEAFGLREAVLDRKSYRTNGAHKAPLQREAIVSSKFIRPLAELLTGNDARRSTVQPLALQSSFDDDGRYLKDPVYAYFIEHLQQILSAQKSLPAKVNVQFFGSYKGY